MEKMPWSHKTELCEEPAEGSAETLGVPGWVTLGEIGPCTPLEVGEKTRLC